MVSRSIHSGTRRASRDANDRFCPTMSVAHNSRLKKAFLMGEHSIVLIRGTGGFRVSAALSVEILSQMGWMSVTQTHTGAIAPEGDHLVRRFVLFSVCGQIP